MSKQKVKIDSTTCKEKTEVYSRVVGFYRPVKHWNEGKKEEFFDRKNYRVNNN